MKEFRPVLSSLEEFVQHVDQVPRPTGYRLVAAVPDEGVPAVAVAVAGFRLGENLAWGRHLYVDDPLNPVRRTRTGPRAGLARVAAHRG